MRRCESGWIEIWVWSIVSIGLFLLFILIQSLKTNHVPSLR